MAETDTVVAQGYARVMVNVDEYRRLTEAATELARLQAENEALRRELGEESDESMWRFWRDKAAALATKCDAEKAARKVAQAENEALRRERDEARGNYDGLLTTWAESRERHLAAEAKMLDLQGALRDVLPYAVTCIGLPRPCWPTDSVILRAEALLKGAPHG